jgi:hypothetical protein
MHITTRGRNGALSKKEAKYILNLFADVLLGKRLSKNISLKLYFQEFGDNTWGMCYPTDYEYNNHREFEIFIDPRLSFKSQIKTLGHEMVHLKQFARGELKQYANEDFKWLGKRVEIEYDTPQEALKKPWEREAKQSEDYLYNYYINSVAEEK